MTELRQRRPRVRDPGYLEWLRDRPCCVCSAVGRTQAAHIRMSCLERGKEFTGAQKPDDRWATPLCGPDVLHSDPGCHATQHSGNEAEFWQRAGKDPFVIAERLYARYLASLPAEARERRAKPPVSKAKRPKRAHQRKAGAAKGPKRKIASRPNSWPKGQKLRSRGFRKD